jgi:hypothetical protein
LGFDDLQQVPLGELAQKVVIKLVPKGPSGTTPAAARMSTLVRIDMRSDDRFQQEIVTAAVLKGGPGIELRRHPELARHRTGPRHR